MMTGKPWLKSSRQGLQSACRGLNVYRRTHSLDLAPRRWNRSPERYTDKTIGTLGGPNMATFIRLDLQGTSDTQEIQNTWYYGRDDGEDTTFDAPLLLNIAQQFANNVASSYTALLPITTVFSKIVASLVDEKNKKAGFYSVEADIDLVGTLATVPITAGWVAVCAFTCVPFVTNQPYRVISRSNVRYGPITRSHLNPDQVIASAFATATSTMLTNALRIIEGPDGNDYVPVRVGTESQKSLDGSAGRIVLATMRPRAVPLRSRTLKPDGSN